MDIIIRSHASDGKSRLASWLAHTLSQMGQDVTLKVADVKAPDEHALRSVLLPSVNIYTENYPEENTVPEAAPTILEEANKLIYGQRQQDYGKAKDNCENIAKLWSVILGTTVTAEQVCLCMIQVKAARLINTPDHHDSWVDIAGYVGVKGKIDRGE